MAYSSLILSDGPEAYLPLDGAALGGDLADHTGHGHDASAHGSGPTATGAGPFGSVGAYTFGSAHVYTGGTYYFDSGAGSWLTLANPSTLPAGQASSSGAFFSWEGWVRADAAGTGGFWVAATSGTTPGSGPQFWPRYGAQYTGAAATDAFTGLPVPSLLFGAIDHGARWAGAWSAPHAWHYLALVWDGVAQGRIYLDATEVDSGLGAGTPGTFDPYAPAAVAIGATTHFFLPRPSFTAGAFDGDIAQVALYPYALTPCQIQAHYDEALLGHHTPCRAQMLAAQVQIIDGWGRTGTIHDAGTPQSALVTQGGDPLTVPTITP